MTSESVECFSCVDFYRHILPYFGHCNAKGEGGEIENIYILCARVLLCGNGKCETGTKFMKYGYFWIPEAVQSSPWSKHRAHISTLLTFK